MIQQALRKQLGQDVTVVTVAHRLSTIKEYDKVVSLHAVCPVLLNVLTGL